MIEWLVFGRSGLESSTWRRLERIQDANLTRAGRVVDGPSSQYHKSVGPCTIRQGSLGLILIPRPSRAREVATPMGTNMGAVAHNWTPVKSE